MITKYIQNCNIQKNKNIEWKLAARKMKIRFNKLNY